jgi:hypothetical protein
MTAKIAEYLPISADINYIRARIYRQSKLGEYIIIDNTVGRRAGRRRAGSQRAGRRRVGRRRAGRGRRVLQQPPPWPVAGDGAPRCEVRGEVFAFQRFLERAAEIHLWAPNWPWVRHPTGE